MTSSSTAGSSTAGSSTAGSSTAGSSTAGSSTAGRSFTILDGGMGRELQRIGAPFRQPEWSALALIEGPEWVVQAHRNFIDAGAQVITTNAYAVVPFHIGAERFKADGHRLATIAGESARTAADSSGERAVRVAASLPPLFGSYRPDLFDATAAPAIIDPLVDAQAGFADIWLGETLSSIAEAIAVRAALDRAGERRELWLSFTLAEQPWATLRSGERVAEAARAAADLGATTLLFNCCQVETVIPALDAAHASLGDVLALGAYANRFVEHHDDNGSANEQLSAFRDDIDPPTYAQEALRWQAHGATVIGGCCGIGPEYLAAISSCLATSE